MAILYNRREEVRQLLRMTAAHLAAKERGEDSTLGFAKMRPLDADGQVIGSWRQLGPVRISFSVKEVDPEFIALLTGEKDGR